ncbi:MAG: hypothetical protein KF871_06150 [Hydrogenophaga sp.]|uniref:hypothetical protein n=1 Tax=Hydrogenophaga sp. TaxID=1904254 RepID=UPI001DEA8EAC|nr:hypothetical protein [Hydrogenophaga sp.]MBX3609462.1 hypothetical protein [Hydrogenophaga sp.]
MHGLLQAMPPGAHDNLTHLIQGAAKPQANLLEASGESVSESAVHTARAFLQTQADLQTHIATLRADMTSEALDDFESALREHLQRHESAAEALLTSYREATGKQGAEFYAAHQPAQFASHTLKKAGESAPERVSVFERCASNATKQAKADFDKDWHAYQLEHLEDHASRVLWNLMAGYVGQLSGTGLGGHLGRALALGAATAGVAGVPAAALGALVGLVVTPVAHTLLSDPLQAMLRDVTVTSPGAELQLEMFKLKARLITDAYREQNGRAVRPDFKWLDEQTGVVHLVTAKEYLQRMEGRLPGAFGAWTDKFVEEDLPYVFGDGIVGTLRPMLRGTDPEWWTQTTAGKLTEWLGLQIFVLGPLCGAINHTVSQCFREWKVGKIPALEKRLALAQSDTDRRRYQAELAFAREELKRLRHTIETSRPDEVDLRRDLGKRVASLVGDGAREDVNKPMALWQRECVWLTGYVDDLQSAIHDLRSWTGPLSSDVSKTQEARDRELEVLGHELRAMQKQLAEAQAKSSISGNYDYRLNTLLQRQHRLNPSEPETPGKRWETLSTVLGKATGMLPFVAAQVFAARLQSAGGASLSTTLVSAALPPLYFIGSGGLLGWMSRSEWAGVWRQAIAHARGRSMTPTQVTGADTRPDSEDLGDSLDDTVPAQMPNRLIDAHLDRDAASLESGLDESGAMSDEAQNADFQDDEVRIDLPSAHHSPRNEPSDDELLESMSSPGVTPRRSGIQASDDDVVIDLTDVLGVREPDEPTV